jgi:hypothetical protein
MPPRMQCHKHHGGKSSFGYSKIKDLYLTIVEIEDAGASKPVLATAISTVANYLTSIGAYTTFKYANVAVSRAHLETKQLEDNSPEPTKPDISWTINARKAKRTFLSTKHVEKPVSTENINEEEEVKVHNSEYCQQDKERSAKQ